MMTVTYKNDDTGRLSSATGTGNFNGDDGYGNKTTGSIGQAYSVIKGQAKLSESKTNSSTSNLDGSTQQQMMTVTYKNDDTGRLSSATATGNFNGDDGYGNKT